MAAIEEHREIVERWATFYQNMQPLLKRYQAAYEAQHRARHDSGLGGIGIQGIGLAPRNVSRLTGRVRPET